MISWKIVAKEIFERTKRDAYKIVTTTDRKLTIFDSKIGGLPYWDLNKEYPTDTEGKPLLLLAQINFSDLAKMSKGANVCLPETGILQFFIGDGDLYGMDFDQQDSQKAFRVVYHEDVDSDMTKDQLIQFGIKEKSDKDKDSFSPVNKECGMEFVPQTVGLGVADYEYGSLFVKILKEMGEDVKEDDDLYDLLEEEELEELYDNQKTDGHWLLGFPYFTQTDPREYEENYRYYDTMLLQIDSENVSGGEWKILWGDCGVGNFFINGEDLKKRQFQKILYNWDCC